MERVGVGFETSEYVQKRLELGAAQQKLVAHCKATGLTRQYAREKAYGVTAQPRALWSEDLLDDSKYVKADRALINELQRQSDEVFAAANEAELNSIAGYTTGEHNHINQYLYGKNLKKAVKENTEKDILNIDTLVDRFNLNKNIKVYSGTNAKHYEGWKEGDVKEISGYLSTSVRFKDAKRFYHREIKREHEALMLEILVPKKTKCLFIGEKTSFSDYQAEMLLKHGLQYKVVKRTKDKMILEVFSNV